MKVKKGKKIMIFNILGYLLELIIKPSDLGFLKIKINLANLGYQIWQKFEKSFV
jgi:hypothetical protein